MEHCRSPDGVTSISVRPYYTMMSRVYLALAMSFLVISSRYELIDGIRLATNTSPNSFTK